MGGFNQQHRDDIIPILGSESANKESALRMPHEYIRAFDCSTIQHNSQIAHHPRECWGLFVTIAPACPGAVIKANACVLGGR
jgi:hypothetical protein